MGALSRIIPPWGLVQADADNLGTNITQGGSAYGPLSFGPQYLGTDPDFRYVGNSATSSNWVSDGFGGTMAANGAGATFGTASTIFTDGTTGVTGASGFGYTSSTNYPLGTDDFLVVMCFDAGPLGSNQQVFDQRSGGGAGIEADFLSGPNQFRAQVEDDGGDLEASGATAIVTASTEYIYIITGDRSGNMKQFFNGLQAGSIRSLASIGTTSCANLALMRATTSANHFLGTLYFATQYTFPAGTLSTDGETEALDIYNQLTGN